jgi:hypothetical protein
MAIVHGKGTSVLVSSTDLSGYFNSADCSQSVETAETTAFGNASKSYITGLRDGTASLSGMWDGAASAVDSVLASALAGSGLPVTIGQAGLAAGNRCQLMLAHETSYGVTAAVADVVQVSADLQSSAGLWSGIYLRSVTAETSSTNGSSVDNGSSSSNGLRANLHVTAGSGSATIKVQVSADASTWVDLITFTAATGATGEHKTVTGTVNRYLRSTSTISGGSPSFSYTVSVAR